MNNYEQKYKEALEKINKMVSDGHLFVETAEEYFPELKESGDERIRKELIKNFKLLNGKQCKGQKWGAHEELLIDDILAWLEKQGEQNPTDKAESKFHEGEWITIKE